MKTEFVMFTILHSIFNVVVYIETKAIHGYFISRLIFAFSLLYYLHILLLSSVFLVDLKSKVYELKKKIIDATKIHCAIPAKLNRTLDYMLLHCKIHTFVCVTLLAG